MDQKLVQKIIQQNKAAYERVSDFFNDSRKFAWPEFSDLTKYVKAGDSVLDLGCGNGRLIDALEGKAVDYSGLDISQSIIEAAQQRYPQAKFIQGDLTNFSLPEKFDSIFMVAAFHHIPSASLRLKVLENIHAHLKDGGYIIMTNWNLRQGKYRRLYMSGILKKLLGQNKSPALQAPPLKRGNKLEWRGTWIPFNAHGKKVTRYYYGFNLRLIKKALRQSGFKAIENYYVKKGKRVNFWNGWNIVTVAQK